MVRRCVRWVRTRPIRTAFLLLALAFLALNVVAYLHAWSMTHFTRGGTKTPGAERLTALGKVAVLITGVHVPKPANEATPAAYGLPFECHRFPGGAGDLHAWYVPHPRPKALVLLLHGYSGCKASQLREARAFHELGCAAFLLDFRCSGDSDGWETTVGYKEADDVARAADYAAGRWPGLPLVLYGQSMGSAAALRAVAVHGTRPAALVLENPFDRFLSTVENRFGLLGLPAFPAARLLVFWGGVQHGIAAFDHNPVEYAAQVACPVLLLHGRADRMVTAEQAEAIFRRLPGQKRLEWFADVGHGPLLAPHPGQWRQAVSQFLGDVLGRSGGSDE
jgi:alpha-beta hydrolase superfamily lysophospholipase